MPRLLVSSVVTKTRFMKEITLKNGSIISGIAAFFLFSEILLYFILGISAQAASGSGIRLFFDGFYFLMILTSVVGAFALVSGILNKWYKIIFNWYKLLVASFIVAVALLYCL